MVRTCAVVWWARLRRANTETTLDKNLVGRERDVMPPRGTANELQQADTVFVFAVVSRRIPTSVPTIDSLSDRATSGRSPLYPLFCRPHGKYFSVIRCWPLRAAIARNIRSAELASAGR